MTRNNLCLICLSHSSKAHSCHEVTTMSGRSIFDIISSILTLKEITDNEAVTCQSCFELVDEIDAFEHSLSKAKSRLKGKHERSQKRAEFRPGDSLVFIDRLLIKAKLKSPQDLGQFEAFRDDFMQDLNDICHQTPVKIDNNETCDAFTIALLRSECSSLELNIPGELDCFTCNKSFKSVFDRIQHRIHDHEDPQVFCRHCSKSFPQEQEAFDHNSEENLDLLKIIRDPDQLKCLNCNLTFHSKLSYWAHFYKRHPKYSLMTTCPLCPVQDISDFKRHFLINHCQYVFQCQSCPVIFEDLAKIVDHLDSHEDVNDQDDIQDDPKAKKKYPYVSKLLARSFRTEPLSNLEHFKANFDMALFPPQDPSKVITSFNDVPEDVKEDACKTLDLMRTMPNIIDSYQSQLNWDLVMLKCQVPSLTFGIPGESLCHECHDSKFNLIQDRFSHHFEVHANSNFACLSCDKFFNANEALVKHLKKHHKYVDKVVTIQSGGVGYVTSSGWSQCTHCPDAGFASEFALWTHNYESHKRSSRIKRSLECPVCGKSSSNAMDFKRHILILHGGFTHSCMICGKRYSSRDSIASHLRTHGNDKKVIVKSLDKKIEPQTCNECGWASKSKLLHDRHMLATHGIQIAQVCHVCQETLPDPKALVEHKRSVHSNDICYICAKSFLNLGDLNMHISRMHPEMANLGQELGNAKHKPIKVLTNRKEKTMCEICSKMVLTHNIKLHMKNHQDKQIACPKCPRMFRWNSSLTSHLSSAHGDQVKTVTIACEFCGKQFKDKSNLRQHRYSHTGGPHSCKTCGRGFGRKDLLSNHAAKCSVTASGN